MSASTSPIHVRPAAAVASLLVITLAACSMGADRPAEPADENPVRTSVAAAVPAAAHPLPSLTLPTDAYPGYPQPIRTPNNAVAAKSPPRVLKATPAREVGGGGAPGSPIRPARYGNAGAPSELQSVMPGMLPATGRAAQEHSGGETYEPIWDNPFLTVADAPLSTFAIDVDTASYANVRRFLVHGDRPPRDAVRIEELLNYFTYDDPPPEGDAPFSATTEVVEAPWQPDHLLLRVGLKGRSIDLEGRPTGSFVFLLDVSGSMQASNKLPLVKEAMRMLASQLGENDRVAIVVYAGASGLVLPPTAAHDQQTIHDAIERLQSGGSTAGAEGIQLAYQVAGESFLEGGVNRVILATDGDFNVGVTDIDELQALIEEQAQVGVFLTVLGFGMGNLKDATLERLADKGNGNYAYIDTIHEARKVLVEEIGGTLVTIAKDVKVQVELNPSRVAGYRLIGYENRILADEDFNDDTKDAGEIGAGHSVTALYELVPAGHEVPQVGAPPTPAPEPAVAVDDTDAEPPDIDPPRYADPVADATVLDELLVVKLRYKAPDGDVSARIDVPVVDEVLTMDNASADTRFAAAVAAFGMLLRDSPFSGTATFDDITALAESGLGADARGHRAAFLDLVRVAADPRGRTVPGETPPSSYP